MILMVLSKKKINEWFDIIIIIIVKDSSLMFSTYIEKKQNKNETKKTMI